MRRHVGGTVISASGTILNTATKVERGIMARIAIVHSEFHSGGAEAVCLSVIEALQSRHSVDLFAFEPPDMAELNAQFGTNAHVSSINSYPRISRVFEGVNRSINRVSGDAVGAQIAMKSALHYQLVSDKMGEFDCRISTKSELPLPSPSVQYVHEPFFNKHKFSGHFSVNGAGRHYQSLATRVAGASPENISENAILTNSSWTASEIAQCYSEPTVVYPPVSVSEFGGLPFDEREDGFVMIGRISRDKHVHRAIDILQEVRSREPDVHLHLIGPMSGHDPEYHSSIRERVADLDFVSLEGKLSRTDLIEMVETHKWGIHAKPYEHFGISVAEMVAGGVIPFVPDSGGQTDIVGNEQLLTYQTVDEAVGNICHVINDEPAIRKLRRGLPDPEQFSKETFQQRIRHVVEERIHD